MKMETTDVQGKISDLSRTAKIIADSYLANVQLWPGHIMYSKKKHFYQSKHHFDCYASDNFIAFANLPKGKVKIRSAQKYLDLEGHCILFQPPFSLIETFTLKGELTWECIAFKKEISISDKNPRVLFTQVNIPRTNQEIARLLEKLHNEGIEIIQETKPSAIAEKLKKAIDKNFCDNIKLTTLADQLRCSRVVMTRAFTKTYNISPVEYRHKLRIHEALLRVRYGLSITDALYEVGFSDPSQFIHHFKRLLGTTPNQYKIMKNL